MWSQAHSLLQALTIEHEVEDDQVGVAQGEVGHLDHIRVVEQVMLVVEDDQVGVAQGEAGVVLLVVAQWHGDCDYCVVVIVVAQWHGDCDYGD